MLRKCIVNVRMSIEIMVQPVTEFKIGLDPMNTAPKPTKSTKSVPKHESYEEFSQRMEKEKFEGYRRLVKRNKEQGRRGTREKQEWA